MVISVEKNKIKQKRVIGSAVSNKVIKEGLTEKVIHEEATWQTSKEREFQVEGIAKAGEGEGSRWERQSGMERKPRHP